MKNLNSGSAITWTLPKDSHAFAHVFVAVDRLQQAGKPPPQPCSLTLLEREEGSEGQK